MLSTSRFTRLATIGIAGLVGVGLAGCGSSSTASKATPTPTITLSPVDRVSKVVLVAADLTNGQTVKLIDGGDQVTDQVTLDNCGYDFTSEAHRLARNQVEVLSSTGRQVGEANEVVAYDSEAAAAKALDEFRTSVTSCPKNVFQKSTVAGVPDLRYDVSAIVAQPNLPVSDNAVATIAVTVKGSTEHLYGVLIFQRRGTVLDGVYLQSPTKPTAANLAALQALAEIAGRKLAAT